MTSLKQTKFAVSRKLLESLMALQNAINPKLARSYTNKIRLDFERMKIVATDGHILCQHELSQNDKEAFFSIGHFESVSLEFSKDALKNLMKDKKNLNFYIERASNGIIFGSPTNMCLALVFDYFPSYAQVIPGASRTTMTVSFDFDLLEKLVKSFQKHKDVNKCNIITLDIISPLSPIIVRSGDNMQSNDSQINIIMPVGKK